MSYCPCGSLASYADCCQPCHQQTALPQTAEQLMRSRYSAYALLARQPERLDYLIHTTVPAQRALLDQKAMKHWGTTTDWAKLDILNHWPKQGKHHAEVEFKAYFHRPEGLQYHHERSAFVRIVENNTSRWYFLDPTVPVTLTQKQPCLCGSGEKFKHCCGKYLKPANA